MSFQQDRNQADTIDANVSVRKNNRCMIGQIFTANNEKQHFWQIHKAFNAHILTKLPFVEMSAKHEIYTSECRKMQLRVFVTPTPR